MEQSELNGITQKWLEGLAQIQQQPEQKPDFGPLTPKGQQDLNSVLETLTTGLKITSVLKTSLHAGGTHLAVLARGIASYLSVALETRDVDHIAGLVHAHVAQCLLQLTGLGQEEKCPLASTFHDDLREGFVRVFQMALFKKYDKMATEGLLAAANKPPVVYVGARGEIGLLYHVCARIGLPPSCVNIIPCSTTHGLTHTIDINALEKRINDDCNQGKTPLLVIAYAGTPLAGHVEDIQGLKYVCDHYKMWLHVTGHGLSSLCLSEEKDELKAVSLADSFTLFPSTWFGILNCPMITLHKHPTVIQTNGVPTSSNFPGENPSDEGEFPIPGMTWAGLYPHGLPKMLPLTLWVCLHYLGSSALIDTVSYCRSLTKCMISHLDDIPGITRIAIPSHTSYVVLFKYSGGGQLVLPSSLKKLIKTHKGTPLKNEKDGNTEEKKQGEEEKKEREEEVKKEREEEKKVEEEVKKEEEEKGEEEKIEEKKTEDNDKKEEEEDDEPLVVTIHGMPISVTNMYNVLISKELQAHFPKVGIATYDLGGKDGVVFRFDPVTSFPEHSTSVEDIEKFAEDIKQRVESIHPIAQARCLFEVALRGQISLRWMEFPNLHCIAVVQYVPTDWVDKQELTVEEVNDLNRRNMELCHYLGQCSSVFAPFQHGNFTCIFIKELPKDKSMFELLELLMTETNKFEDQIKYLEGVSAKIQESIKAAEQDLNKEKKKEESEEGFLKYVPIVGSVMGWLYPTSPTGRIGRTYNLAAGKIEDTSSVYKHRLQLVNEEIEREEEPEPQNEIPESKTTPTKGDEEISKQIPEEVQSSEQ